MTKTPSLPALATNRDRPDPLGDFRLTLADPRLRRGYRSVRVSDHAVGVGKVRNGDPKGRGVRVDALGPRCQP